MGWKTVGEETKRKVGSSQNWENRENHPGITSLPPNPPPRQGIWWRWKYTIRILWPGLYPAKRSENLRWSPCQVRKHFSILISHPLFNTQSNTVCKPLKDRKQSHWIHTTHCFWGFNFQSLIFLFFWLITPLCFHPHEWS